MFFIKCLFTCLVLELLISPTWPFFQPFLLLYIFNHGRSLSICELRVISFLSWVVIATPMFIRSLLLKSKCSGESRKCMWWQFINPIQLQSLILKSAVQAMFHWAFVSDLTMSKCGCKNWSKRLTLGGRLTTLINRNVQGCTSSAPFVIGEIFGHNWLRS